MRTSRPWGRTISKAILRENLSLALSDSLDNQVVNGNGTAPNLAGIFQPAHEPECPGCRRGDLRFTFVSRQFAGGIDGLWSSTIKEVAIVAGVETFQLSAKTFRDIAAADLGSMSLADYAMSHYGGWWTNKRMPAKASAHSAGHPVPHGAVHDGRRRGNADGGLPPLGRGRDRRYLLRECEGGAVFHPSRSPGRRDSWFSPTHTDRWRSGYPYPNRAWARSAGCEWFR